MLCMAYRALFRKDRTALFILVGYLAQLVPWVFVTRIVFEYHYFPCSLFLLLALGYMFSMLEERPGSRWVIFSYAGVAAVLFIAFYPALSGAPVSYAYGTNFLKWLPSWPF